MLGKTLMSQTYFRLLYFCNGISKPTFRQLAVITGVCRQTLAKHWYILLENGIITIDEEDVMYVENYFNLSQREIAQLAVTSNFPKDVAIVFKHSIEKAELPHE